MSKEDIKLMLRGYKWISSGCRVDVEWMLSGWGVDINIDMGLFCSCYMEQQ